MAVRDTVRISARPTTRGSANGRAFGGGEAEPGTSDYLRPGGVDTYLRPGGTDTYKRPSGL